MLGEKIRSRREEIGLTQKDLANKVELTPGFLSQIERNISKPSITSLRKIASALDVAVFYFLMEEEIKSPIVRKNERTILKSKTQ